jgi:Trk K+ transport system NAD-binding subunit
MEVKVLKNMEGKSLKELDLRRKYNITALIHKKNDKEKAHIITDASMILKEGDSLLVAGDKNNIYKAFS